MGIPFEADIVDHGFLSYNKAMRPRYADIIQYVDLSNGIMLHVPLIEACPDDDWEEGYETWESESELDNESIDGDDGDNRGASDPQEVLDSTSNPLKMATLCRTRKPCVLVGKYEWY